VLSNVAEVYRDPIVEKQRAVKGKVRAERELRGKTEGSPGGIP
jgi:hypothetical protein